MVPSGPTLDPITSIYSFLPSRRVPSDHGEAAAEKSCPVNTQIFPTVFCHVQWDQAGRQGRAVRHEFSSSSALFKVPFVVNQRPSLTTSRARSTTAAAHRPRQPDPSVMPPPHQLTFMLGDHVSYVKLPPPPPGEILLCLKTETMSFFPLLSLSVGRVGHGTLDQHRAQCNTQKSLKEMILWTNGIREYHT